MVDCGSTDLGGSVIWAVRGSGNLGPKEVSLRVGRGRRRREVTHTCFTPARKTTHERALPLFHTHTHKGVYAPPGPLFLCA